MKNATTFTVPHVLCSAYARDWARILRLFFLDIEKTLQVFRVVSGGLPQIPSDVFEYVSSDRKPLDAPVNAVQVRLQAHADPVGLERHERLHLLLRQHDATVLGGGTELGLGDAPVAVPVEQGMGVGGRRQLGSRGGGGVGHGWKRRGGRDSE